MNAAVLSCCFRYTGVQRYDFFTVQRWQTACFENGREALSYLQKDKDFRNLWV